MKRLSYFFLITTITLLGCSKGNSPAAPITPDTKLELNVTDLATGQPVAGASVSLYLSLADWQTGANALASMNTNSSGSARFSNLSSMKYYYYISQGCKSNLFEANVVNTAIPAGTLTTLFVGISSTGSLRFVNTFSNPIRVDLNGITLLPSLAASSSYTMKARAGVYNIRMVRLSGGSYDQTFIGALGCGDLLITTAQ